MISEKLKYELQIKIAKIMNIQCIDPLKSGGFVLQHQAQNVSFSR